MRKTLQKLSTILLCAYCATAEPQLPSKEYLPPQEGYNYGAPSIPFPSPQPSYRPPPPPPSPAPIYSSPPPLYSTPRPYQPPKPSYGTPFESGSAISPVGQEGAGTGGGEFDHLRQPHVPGMPFDFAYAVKDDIYGNDFGHQATSNGDQVRGEYRTLLPDGRLQIVKYIADWKDGYTAEVSYQGEAKYPPPPQPQQQQQISGGGVSGGSISGASQSINGYAPYAPSGYRPSVPFTQPSPSPSYYQPPKTNFLKPSYAGSQPGPAIPSAFPSLSSPRPSAGYSQQPVSGYGGNANQPSSASYASSPAPTYASPTGDYGNYRKK